MPQNQNPMGDQEMLGDGIATQKLITSAYNTFANECAEPTLRNDFLDILHEEHMIQAELFDEMQSRGWYTLKPADAMQVTQTKQKYQNVQF